MRRSLGVRIAVIASATATAVGGLVAVNGSAAAGRSAAGKPASSQVAANTKVVRAFIRDVLNEHRGDHAIRYLTRDMQWHGGSVGTVAGGQNVAGLLAGVVTAIPDLRADVKDIVAQGNKVVVRLVVSGTQRGALLGVAASGRHVRWDAVDVYRLKGGKIAEEWAAEDFTAFLNTTGTYKAPWIQ